MYHDVVDAGAEDTSGFPGRRHHASVHFGTHRRRTQRVRPDARRPLRDSALDHRADGGRARRRTLAALRATGGGVEREEDDEATRRRTVSANPKAAAASW